MSEMEARMLGNGDGARLHVERTILHAPFAALPPSQNGNQAATE
jgi:hypothetical protein